MMKHLYIATPTYTNTVTTGYCQSLAATIVACTKAKILVSGPDFKGGPYVEANRNWLVRRFMDSAADAILFIDDDLTWDERAVIKLYESEHALVGGVYPKKQDEEEYPAKLLEHVDENGFREAVFLPGGFMLIRREVFSKLSSHVPVYMDANYNGLPVHGYFQNVYYEQRPFTGEDVEFCNRWRRIGGKVWCWEDIDFEHQGPKQWAGNVKRHRAAEFVPVFPVPDIQQKGGGLLRVGT